MAKKEGIKPWHIGLGALFLFGGAVALGGRKEPKGVDRDEQISPTVIETGARTPSGYMPPPELAKVWGPGPWNTIQRQNVEKYLEQASTRGALMEVYPGLAYFNDWLKKRKIPLLLDPGFAGIHKNLQYGPPLAQISPYWETDLDSAMLKSGMGIRLHTSMLTGYNPKLGAPRQNAVFRLAVETFSGRMFAWNAFTGEWEEAPISDAPNGVLAISERGASSVRDAINERFPTAMAYGDSDRILYVLSTFDGKNRKALNSGPQNEIGRARVMSTFPPYDEKVDVQAVLAADGGSPTAGLLENPEGWLANKKGEAIKAGAGYLADKAEDLLGGIEEGMSEELSGILDF